MTSLEHDGAASLDVMHLSGWPAGAGWYVVRTCPCHKDKAITRPFDNREQAERVLQSLDFDARYLSPRKETK